MKILLALLLLTQADAEFARLEEWAKAQPDNGPGRVGVGDEYWKAAKKFPKERMRFMDKANESWASGWPMLDAVWKDKTRENLRKLYCVSAFSKGNVSGERVRSGVLAARLPMPKGNEGNYHQPLKLDVAIPAGAKSIEVSAWVLADGTDSTNDDMKPCVSSGAGKLLSATGSPIPMDLPVWTRISQTIKGDGAQKLSLVFEFQSRSGTVYVDDVSVKVDGKELLRDGGFEGK